MDYQQAIYYLFNKLPMFSRIGAAAYKKDLTNTLLLCHSIGDPQTKFKSVHIAGTNGKGSTSHMLAAILQAAGYKTGLYTSPHLKDFRERIRVDGEMIREDFVTEFVDSIQGLSEEIEPSFFEVTVAMAFEYFASEKVDIAIVEVGLGGRLDSTNIIQPEISVITNIGYDHMNLLGDTLEKIAFEKGGIIKYQTPVLIGESHPETKPVFEKIAAGLEAPLYFADRIRFIGDWKFGHHNLVAEVTSIHSNDKEYYELDLPGIYQTKNLVTVLEAVRLLQTKGWAISLQQVQKALKQVRKMTGLHGRWETIHEHPTIVLDVAHNEDGITQLIRQIEITDHEELHIVFGMVKDKETDRVLSLLPRQARYYFTRAQIPRALPEDHLAEKARLLGLAGHPYPTVGDALQAARSHAGRRDLIVVCGSVFIVGEVEI